MCRGQTNLAMFIVSASLLVGAKGNVSSSGHLVQRSHVPSKGHPNADAYLTGARPAVCIPVDLTTLEGPSPHLAITLLRVANPDSVALSILVTLEPRPPANARNCPNTEVPTQPTSIVLGDLGVYPSDQPGRYALDISAALKRLRDSGQNLANLRLRLTLKRLHPEQPINRLEVVLSPPEWTGGAS